jgi:hypothetical protein
MPRFGHISSATCRNRDPPRAAGRANLHTHPKENVMHANRPEPNAELARSFEPLRIAFALSALLLGLLATLRF